MRWDIRAEAATVACGSSVVKDKRLCGLDMRKFERVVMDRQQCTHLPSGTHYYACFVSSKVINLLGELQSLTTPGTAAAACPGITRVPIT